MKKLIALAVTLSPAVAVAHAGHGATADPVLHLLGEPVHALPLLAMLVGGVALVGWRRAQKARNR